MKKNSIDRVEHIPTNTDGKYPNQRCEEPDVTLKHCRTSYSFFITRVTGMFVEKQVE